MELRDYLDVVGAHRWMVIGTIVMTTVVAVVASMLQPSVYEGEARVLVREQDAGAALLGNVLPELSSQPERGLETQIELMQVRPLVERTIRSLNLKTRPDQLLKRTTVEARGKTNIVSIKVKDSDPDRAAAIANGLAKEFVEWSRATQRESMQAAAQELQSRLAEAEQRVVELGRKVGQSGKQSELGAELQIATGSYTTLAERLEQLVVNQQLEEGAGRVVSPAVRSDRISPEPVLSGLIGLGLGILGGIGAAFVFDRLDTTLRSSEQAERLLPVPVLGEIPVESIDEGATTPSIIRSPGSRIAESYRAFRTSLDFINFNKDIKTLMITSAAPMEGKSTVAANLAASLAQAGRRVVLVSCDFRRPMLETLFGVPTGIGLSQVLMGAHSVNQALQRTCVEPLLVMTAGRMPPNPCELLCSDRMREMLDGLERSVDWVVLDTPPLLAVSDAAAVARWADGVLMVVRGGVSKMPAVRKAADVLEKAGARLVGTVVCADASEDAALLGRYQGRYGFAYYGYTRTDRTPQDEVAVSTASLLNRPVGDTDG